MEMVTSWDYRLVVLSVIIAIIGSFVALDFAGWIAFWMKHENPNLWFYQKVGSAIVMGIAISGMHYTAMVAAHYYHTGPAVYGGSIVPTVGNFTLSDLLIIASVLFGAALLLLNSQTARDKQVALQALQTSVAHKSAILSSSLDAVITIDKKGRIIEWNPGFERIFGYTPSEIQGQNLAALIIPERYREAYHKGLEHFLATGVK